MNDIELAYSQATVSTYLGTLAFLDGVDEISSECFHLWKSNSWNNIFAHNDSRNKLFCMLYYRHAVKN